MALNLLLFTIIFISNLTSILTKPHVIVICVDDLGWNDVGFHGANDILTPNIDALAYSGIILQNYYVLPICTPSRSALMTGFHPINIGMQHKVLYASEPWGLPLDIKILPQYLKTEGYDTHAVGKWHLGHFKEAYTPEYRGFDSHFGYWTGKEDYYDHTAQEKSSWGYDMRRGLNVSWDSFGEYATDLFTAESVNLIHSHNSTVPLFLYVAHLAVHSANMYQFLQAPQYAIDKFKHIEDENRRTFAAMVWKLDESVGEIVKALAEKNMLKNTIIIFTTDNGGPAAGFNYNAASNWPLRGVKDTLWEGGVRGSAMMWSPELPGSIINNNLMHIQDWVPTILGAINYKQIFNESVKFDGHNLWPFLKEYPSTPAYDEIVLNIDELRDISALRKGSWKIISGENYNGTWSGWYGPSGRNSTLLYKIEEIENSVVAKTLKEQNISFPSREKIFEIRANVSVFCGANNTTIKDCDLINERYCLFDVAQDPCEMNNRAESEPGILNELILALKKYHPVKPLNQPSDPFSNPKYWNYTWTNWRDFA